MRLLPLFAFFIAPGLIHAQTDCTVPPGTEPDDVNILARVARPTRNDPCQTADSNIARSIKNILAAKPGPVLRSSPWKNQEPAGLRDIARRFALSENEKAMLAKNGFVVPARLTMSGYGYAFHEIYQSEMPLFVSVDAVLHAIYASNDAVIKRVEQRTVLPRLRSILTEMRCALASAGYAPETTHDVDLYLTVARSLLDEKEVKSATGVDKEAAEIEKLVMDASGMSEIQIFGRRRIVDFSQYAPRGHYEDMKGFFRAVMWLSRLEFNMVSRSSRSSHPGNVPDPSETPRESTAAIALSDLAQRTRQLDNLNKIDALWRVLAGRREDLPLADIAALIKRGSLAVNAEAPEKLRALIGNGYQRTMRMHYMPEGSVHLPVITTFLGPRITADSQAFMGIVNPAIPNRYLAGAMDAAYILGSDHALNYLSGDLQAFPTLRTQLTTARRSLGNDLRGDDLYSSWMKAMQGIHNSASVKPAFMRSAAYDQFRLNTTVAAFGQIRHNYVLMAAQAYDEGGCEIPFGYVEPAEALYTELVRYAALGEKTMKAAGAEPAVTAYFARTKTILEVLAKLSRFENEDRALPPDANRFLSMVAEMTPGSTGGPPTYTGWYFDLFFDRNDALRDPSLIADFYTSVNPQKISYAGVSGTMLGVFVVDTGGKPRAVVGPVASAFMATGPTSKRYSDSESAPPGEQERPWASYVAAAPEAPPIALDYPTGEDAPMILYVQKPLPSVTVELLDHHRRPLAVFEIKNPGKKTEIKSPLTKGEKVGAVHLYSGAYHLWENVSWTMMRPASPSFDPNDVEP